MSKISRYLLRYGGALSLNKPNNDGKTIFQLNSEFKTLPDLDTYFYEYYAPTAEKANQIKNLLENEPFLMGNANITSTMFLFELVDIIDDTSQKKTNENEKKYTPHLMKLAKSPPTLIDPSYLLMLFIEEMNKILKQNSSSNIRSSAMNSGNSSSSANHSLSVQQLFDNTFLEHQTYFQHLLRRTYDIFPTNENNIHVQHLNEIIIIILDPTGFDESKSKKILNNLKKSLRIFELESKYDTTMTAINWNNDEIKQKLSQNVAELVKNQTDFRIIEVALNQNIDRINEQEE